MLASITTKPGAKYRSIKNPRVYEALRRRGYSKEQAARISNAQARRRTKAYTLGQLEAFVSSPAYDAAIAGAIAARIPALPSLKGEQIAPGVTRIHGNLCNVHGRYGPCDGGASGGKKPKAPKGRKPRAAKPKKPVKTPEQRAAERQQAKDQNRADVLGKMNIAPDGQQALEALRRGEQPDEGSVVRHGFEQAGLVERGRDGSYRLTASGRSMLSAADAGDFGRAGATVGSGRDRVSARQDRVAAAAERKRQAQAKREQAQKLREQRLAKRGSSRQRTTPRQEQAPAESKPAAPAKPRTPKPRTAEQEAAHQRGLARAESARYGTGNNRRNARRHKAASFQVFKDARGQYRWVAFSSTAYRDRDGEIVSTKALADDCATADALGIYGPLRWWHVPGLDLGVCDFNAMHGRVLIESGTFKSEVVARKVAARAGDLEISLGFLHPPTEPDATGVFHTIRRFERSLTPRGKASNLFTSFHVKESPVMDETKKAALKSLGFSDADIADLETRAAATQKSADEQGVAYKAEEPESPMVYTAPDGTQGLIQDGRFVALKAAPPLIEGSPEEEAAESPEEEAAEPDAMMDDGADDPNALTISDGDVAAIAQAVGAAITQALQPLMGLLDIEKKMQGHVQSLMGTYQAQKDAEQAEAKQRVEQLAETVKAQGEQLTELTGDQPAVPYRPSQAKDNVIGQIVENGELLQVVKTTQPDLNDPWADVKRGLGLVPPVQP